MAQKTPRLFYLLLTVLFVLNLLQAAFTELIYDEAYYWYYAQNLDWGYFDHPSMVALLIKISSLFFTGELGVRFMSCLLSVGIYLIVWEIIDHPKKREYVIHFFLLLFSMTLMNAYGFFTLPDTPLLFFTALFLLLYKRFLNNPNIYISLALGVTMAALMYSKYHAVLVILFVFLSNFKLVFNWKAWFAVGIALACYVPHFLWLMEYDFVSIKYHLFERPNQAYSFEKFTLGYLVNLVAIFGLLFYWVYYALVTDKRKDQFSKALRYLTYGVLIFFFVSSFNRRVQTQWIIVISIPMAIIAFRHLLENEKSRKWMFRMAMISAILLIYARAWLIYQPLLPILYEAHGNKNWVMDLKSKAGDVPVVFENSYRQAPMYEFYAGMPSFSLNNFMYRKNQYSIDGSEDRVRGKDVLYVTKYRNAGDVQFKHPDSSVFYGSFLKDFQSYRKLQCLVEKENENEPWELKIYNPYEFDVPLENLNFAVAYSNAYKQVQEQVSLEVTPIDGNQHILKSKDTVFYSFELPKSKKMEKPSYFRIGLANKGLLTGLQGMPTKIE